MAAILGVDYGRKRIGIAVSDESGSMALPRATIEVTDSREALEAVKRLCGETGAGRIVVGLPLNMDGSKGPMAAEVEQFVAALGRHVEVPVDLWDERFTSLIAERAMLEADLSRRKRKGLRDKMAAQVMLQGYLDGQRA